MRKTVVDPPQAIELIKTCNTPAAVDSTQSVSSGSSVGASEQNTGTSAENGLSDNTGTGMPGGAELSEMQKQGETLCLVLLELQDIKSQMSEFRSIKSQISKLDTTEAATTTLAKDLSNVVGRTAKLETTVSHNASKIQEMNNKVSSTATAVSKQEVSLSKVESWKEEVILSNAGSISKMNELIKTHQRQVDLFHDNTDQIKRDLMVEVGKNDSTFPAGARELLSKESGRHSARNIIGS